MTDRSRVHRSKTDQANVDRTIIVNLAINVDELLKLYSGRARDVAAVATDGKNIRFPAESLKPFVSHNGVQGTFALRIDSNNKLLSIDRQFGF